MAKCKHCSAPLPSDSIICEYCGVRNDIELHPQKHLKTSPELGRLCPDCLVDLKSIDIGKNSRFIIEKCERCYGLFFDNYELERLLDEHLEKSYWINQKKLHALLQYPLHKDRVVYRRCPVCNKFMQRKNYKGRSGVIMDVCKEHGLWLDAGELKQIKEWTALGGKAKAEKDKLNEKHIHVREQRRQRQAGSHGARGYKYSELTEDKNRLSDAMDMLMGMFRFGRYLR